MCIVWLERCPMWFCHQSNFSSSQYFANWMKRVCSKKLEHHLRIAVHLGFVLIEHKKLLLHFLSNWLAHCFQPDPNIDWSNKLTVEFLIFLDYQSCLFHLLHQLLPSYTTRWLRMSESLLWREKRRDHRDMCHILFANLGSTICCGQTYLAF